MTAHTPGPWGIFEERRSGGLSVGPSNNCTVAQIMVPPEGERVDNAHLIAAAPELLAALRAIVDEHVDVFRYVTPQTGLEIRAALAKASGGAK